MNRIFLLVLKRKIGDFLIDFHWETSFVTKFGDRAFSVSMLSKDTLHAQRDYSAGEQSMSLNRRSKTLTMTRLFLYGCLSATLTLSALAQYRSKADDKKKDEPALRSIAVLEWTGDSEKPAASR